MVKSFRKRKPEKWTNPRMPIVRYETSETVKCTCGWDYSHQREKIREDAIDRHFLKRHQGKGIRL